MAVVVVSGIRRFATSRFLTTSTSSSRRLFGLQQRFQSTSPWLNITKGFSMIMRKGDNIELADRAGDLIGNMPDMENPVPESLLRLNNNSFSWEEYLLARGYLVEGDYRNASAEARQSALMWYSNMLTYPLTLAGAWKKLGLRDSKYLTSEYYPVICVVGAEMEIFAQGLWRETAHIVGSRFDLVFIGDLVVDPGTIPRMKDHDHDKMLDNYLQLNPKEDPYVNLHYATVLVEQMSQWHLSQLNAFLSFHPGAGIGNEEYSWEKAFSILRKTKKPMLLTAYDKEDAMRDRNWWSDKFRGEQLLYEKNPWQSMVRPEEIPYNSYCAYYTHDEEQTKGPGRVK